MDATAREIPGSAMRFDELQRDDGQEPRAQSLAREQAEGQSETARVSAASALLDRGYGKPGQQVNADITHYDRMDEGQLRERIAEQLHTLRLLDGGGGGTEH